MVKTELCSRLRGGGGAGGGGGGGGGGGFSPDFCENTILRYELAMMARTCTNNLRVVFSP